MRVSGWREYRGRRKKGSERPPLPSSAIHAWALVVYRRRERISVDAGPLLGAIAAPIVRAAVRSGDARPQMDSVLPRRAGVGGRFPGGCLLVLVSVSHSLLPRWNDELVRFRYSTTRLAHVQKPALVRGIKSRADKRGEGVGPGGGNSPGPTVLNAGFLLIKEGVSYDISFLLRTEVQIRAASERHYLTLS